MEKTKTGVMFDPGWPFDKKIRNFRLFVIEKGNNFLHFIGIAAQYLPYRRNRYLGEVIYLLSFP